MKIRDSHATLNRDKTEFECPSGGLDIISDDGKRLFSIRVEGPGTISVECGGHCKHMGKLFEDKASIFPRACNLIHFQKVESKPEEAA